MEKKDKRLTVPKWVLINRPKIPQTLQNLSDQIVCPSLKIWYSDERKASLWVRSPWVDQFGTQILLQCRAFTFSASLALKKEPKHALFWNLLSRLPFLVVGHNFSLPPSFYPQFYIQLVPYSSLYNHIQKSHLLCTVKSRAVARLD